MRWLALVPFLLAACKYAPPGSCTTSADCRSGLSCTGGVCVGCQSSAECAEWQVCGSTHTCVAAPGRCQASGDCASWQVCDASRQCVTAAGRCAAAADCQAWEDCSSSHTCLVQAGRCSAAAHCQAWEDCDGTHTCVLKPNYCADSNGCQAWESCSALHLCTPRPGQCGGDVDCQSLQRCTSAHVCADAPLDPEQVYLIGTLSEGAGGNDVLASFSRPQDVLGGFGVWILAAATMPDGRVIYEQWNTSNGDRHLRHFASNPFTVRDHAWRQPVDPEANDEVLLAPDACGGGPPFQDWLVRPVTGELAYSCPFLVNGFYHYDWFAQGGRRLASDQHLDAWTAGDLRLVRSATGITYGTVADGVIDAAGAFHPIAGLPADAAATLAVRTDGEAFLVALKIQQAGSPEESAQLWRITADGTATYVGRYAPSINGPWTTRSAMDRQGRLYGIAWDANGDDYVLQMPLQPGTPVVVYSEANVPAQANDFFGPVLNPYAMIHSSHFVTGP